MVLQQTAAVGCFCPFEDFWMLPNFTSRIEQLKFQDDRCVRISICTRPAVKLEVLFGDIFVVLQRWGEFMLASPTYHEGSWGALEPQTPKLVMKATFTYNEMDIFRQYDMILCLYIKTVNISER